MLPKSLVDAAQGLAYWIGYESTLQPWSGVSEAAIRDQLARLIQARIDSGSRKVKREKPYRDFLPGFAKERLDLHVPGDSREPELALEIKRNYSRPLVAADCCRLARLIKGGPIRCFVVIAAEGKRPTKYSTKEGTAKTGVVLEGRGWQARARRVLKASPSFRSAKAAHYVCLLEVIKKT